MSASSSPPPPVNEGNANMLPVTPVMNSTSEWETTINVIAKLLAPDGDGTPFVDPLSGLFAEWEVNSWDDIPVFTTEDLKQYVKDNPTSAIAPLRIWRRLEWIILFARLDHPLTHSLQMKDVIKAVESHRSGNNVTERRTVQFSPASPTRVTQEKKSVPDLTKFSGKDEDFFTWREATINRMGQAGLSSFLSDRAYVDKNNDVAVSVFHALRTALQEGAAANHTTKLHDKQVYDPLILWQKLEEF